MKPILDGCFTPLGPLVPAVFVRRENRFRAAVSVKGGTVAAHVPNSGRLRELFQPGAAVWLSPAGPASAGRRRTAYTLSLVEHAGQLVSVDSHLPGDLIARALRSSAIHGLAATRRFRREVTLGASRIDFWLASDGSQPACWLEVKSVTLVTDRLARFPDAPTSRGRRHVGELTQAVLAGERATIVLVVQRPDADSFAPNDPADPAFGAALRLAARTGVQIRAFTCDVSTTSVGLAREIPVDL